MKAGEIAKHNEVVKPIHLFRVTFGDKSVKSNVGLGDTESVKSNLPQPLCAHTHTHTRGKLHACFHGHNAQEKSRMVFGLTILWFSVYEVRAFGNPVEANLKTEFYHDEENC